MTAIKGFCLYLLLLLSAASCTIGDFLDSDLFKQDDIIFDQNIGTSNSEIFRMKHDGSDITRLTVTSEGVNSMNASWSKDGKFIVFDRKDPAGRNIWIMNADGSNQYQITSDPADDYAPTLSPDGIYVSFTRAGIGACVQSLKDGSFYFIDSGFSIEALTWLPDDQKVVYRGGTGNGDIYCAYPDNTGKEMLLAGAGDYWNPVWSPSPSGNIIAFLRENISFYFDLYVMNADGTGLLKLTDAPNYPSDNAQTPAWSPDGRRIVFTVEGKGIYVIDSDGGNLKEIISGTYGRASFRGKSR